jgi:hypothetical protein
LAWNLFWLTKAHIWIAKQIEIWDPMYNRWIFYFCQHTNKVQSPLTVVFLIFWRHAPKEMITNCKIPNFHQFKTNKIYTSQVNPVPTPRVRIPTSQIARENLVKDSLRRDLLTSLGKLSRRLYQLCL